MGDREQRCVCDALGDMGQYGVGIRSLLSDTEAVMRVRLVLGDI